MTQFSTKSPYRLVENSPYIPANSNILGSRPARSYIGLRIFTISLITILTLLVLGIGYYFYIHKDMTSPLPDQLSGYENKLFQLNLQLEKLSSEKAISDASQQKLDILLKKLEILELRQEQIEKAYKKVSDLGALKSNSTILTALANDSSLNGSRLSAAQKKTAILDEEIANHGLNNHSIYDRISSRQIISNYKQSLALADINGSLASYLLKLRKKTKKLNLPKAKALLSSPAIGGPLISVDLYKSTFIPNDVFNNEMDRIAELIDIYGKSVHALENYPIYMPIRNPQISSRFGPRRDPFLGRSAFHAGIDFRARAGRKVIAAGRGKVSFSGKKGAYGLMVEIRHADGYTTRYAHLSRIKVQTGQAIEAGQIIGLVGSTGRSTGPHLHFEVRRYDKAKNPYHFLALHKS